MAMNYTRFNLIVRWLTTEEGGRKLPPGNLYIGDIDVEDDVVTHRWCFRIVMKNRPKLGQSVEAEGEFLLDSSPFHLMKSGKKVFFYEGNKLVAIGTINHTIQHESISGIQKRIKVSINWLHPEEDGRKIIFGEYHHYHPTIIIPKDDKDRHWSFCVDFYSLPEYGQPIFAEGTFLADFSEGVPWDVMSIDTEFWVMEGNRKIGYGKVIEECRDIDVRKLPSYNEPYKI